MAKEQMIKSKTEPDAPLVPLLDLQKAGISNFMGMYVAFAESIGAMSAEFADFVAQRIKEDVKTQHQLLHCKDNAEAQHIQSEFMQKAIEQYQAETGKLVQMGMSAFKPDGKSS